MNKFRYFFIALLFFSGSVQANKSETVAQSVPLQEQRALGFVDALNADDGDGYEAWTLANRAESVLASATAEQRRQSYAELTDMFGKVTVLGVMLPSEAQTRILVESSAEGSQLEIVFSHEPEPDYKVIGIEFQPFGGSVEVNPEWEDLQELLNEYVANSGIPAWAVAVVSSEKIIDQAVAGNHSINPDSPPAGPNSRFHWGSVSKSVTGTVMGALVEAGKLDWDTTIGVVLTAELGADYVAASVLPAYRTVTLAQLMAHRAGVPPYEDFDRQFVDDLVSRAVNPAGQRRLWALDVLANDQPIHAPGSARRYSNAGITIAGVLLEMVTDKPWEVLVREYVFKPWGMRASGVGWPASSEDQSQTRGHFGGDTEQLEVAPLGVMSDLLAITAPAGNVHSTVADMARYAQLHLAGMNGRDGPLSAATIAQLHTPISDDQEHPEPYSYGWGHRKLADGTLMQWHNGGAGSFYAEIRLLPQADRAVVIMANAGVAEFMLQPLWEAVYTRYVSPQ